VRAAVRRHSARIADATYLLFGAAITIGDVVGARERGSLAVVLTAVAGAVTTAALQWRRRYPVGVAALAVVGMVPAQSLATFPLALGALAVRRRDRNLALVAVAGFPVAVASGAQGPDGTGSAIASALVTMALAMAFGAFVGARRDLLASLRERAEQAEAALALRSDQARLSERTRIAQEMHDVLAHRISLVALHAGGLEVRPDAGPAEVEKAAVLIRSTARQALEDLRGVLGVLRTDTTSDGVDLAPQPRLEDLPRLVASSTAAGAPVTMHDELPPGAAVPEVTGRTVYRVVQEALTNVHKHARGARTTVRLTGVPGQTLAVRVTNLRPFDGEPFLPGAGMGLVGLRERVALAGGRLAAGPTVSGGWEVEATFPWPADGAEGAA
jgi:signal transduction histidine kinase